MAQPKEKSSRRFVRQHVSVRERAVGAVILFMLAGIAAAVAVKGRHFDPHRFALDPEELKSTEAAVPVSSTLRMDGALGSGMNRSEPAAAEAVKAEPAAPVGEADYGAESSSGETGTQPAAGSAEAGDYEEGGANAAPLEKTALETTAAGLTPMSDTEFYGPGNLYEKIDGRAPAYLAFDFKQLSNRSYKPVGGDGSSYVDLYEFDMGLPRNAFGMWASERDAAAKPLDFVADGYRSEMGLFFRQGKIYVQIIASDPGPATMALAEALARDRAKTIPADDAGLGGMKALPAADQVAGSVEYIAANALGQSKLSDVYKAKYSGGKEPVSFFIMAAPDAAKAREAFDEYLKFHKDFGQVAEEKNAEGASVFIGSAFDTWQVVFVRDKILGGAVECKTRGAAEAFVDSYLKGGRP